MIASGSENVMSTGTGFLYEFESDLYLITNGHNLTRMNPEQTVRITQTAAFPVKIKTKARLVFKDKPNAIGLTDFFSINLYNDEDFRDPTWYVHPDKGYLIDVVVIPLERKDRIPEHVKLFPINNYHFDLEYDPIVADDVYILGYPFDITGGKELPIWKRGTIASEPSIDVDNLPKIFVDTATRSGMSGSPVIMQRTGVHGYDGATMKGNEIIGTIRNFIGIYSGRIGAENEFKAQLGIIWKKKVIEEILQSKVKGTIFFQEK
jgi:hypothetical protein